MKNGWDAAEQFKRERDEWKAKYEHAYEAYVELNNGEFAQACEDRNEAVAQRDYWKKQLLSEQADYDKARAENVRLDRMLVHAWAERDALKEALGRIAALDHLTESHGERGAYLRARAIARDAIATLQEGDE